MCSVYICVLYVRTPMYVHLPVCAQGTTANDMFVYTCLFCRIQSLLWGSFAKETYNFTTYHAPQVHTHTVTLYNTLQSAALCNVQHTAIYNTLQSAALCNVLQHTVTYCNVLQREYRMAKTHRVPYLCRSCSVKEPYE